MPRWRPIFVTFALVLTTVAAAPGRARADGAIGFVSTGDEHSPDIEYTWYGYEGLGLDALAALALAGGLADTPVRTPLLLTGVGLFVAGAPALHFAHGHEVRGVASLVLRTTVPLGVGLLSYAGQDCDQHQCDGGDDLMPFLVGTAAAIGVAALDDLFFTWEGHERPRGPTWSPTVTPSAGGMSLGVVGTF